MESLYKKINLNSWVVLVPVVAIYLIAIWRLPPIDADRNPDSRGYVTLATAIVSGDFFERKDPADISWTRAVRTPGYPLLVAAFSAAGIPDDVSGIAWLHGIAGLVAIVLLPWWLRPFSPPLLTAAAVLSVQYSMRDYFSLVLTEWIAMNMALLLLGLFVLAWQRCRTHTLFALGLLSACLVLVRPAMAPYLLLMPLVLIGRRVLPPPSHAVLLLSTVLPLLVWMAFNSYHIGSFSLAQLRGYQLFGVGTQVGHAEVQPGDSAELRQFIEDVNERKRPPMGTEVEYIDNLDERYKAIYMLNALILTRDAREMIGSIELDRNYMEVYGKRAISSNLPNYFKYVRYGMNSWFAAGLVPYLVLWLLLIVVILYWLAPAAPLPVAANAMFLAHLGTGILVAGLEGVTPRYLYPTLNPFIVAALCCIANSVKFNLTKLF